MKTDVKKVVTYVNNHGHSFICFKFNHKECRFCFPRDIMEESANKECEILPKRLDPWINNYESVTISCIRSIMAIKFIGSGKDCRSLAFYITDYQNKSALTTHNTLPLVAACIKK